MRLYIFIGLLLCKSGLALAEDSDRIEIDQPDADEIIIEDSDGSTKRIVKQSDGTHQEELDRLQSNQQNIRLYPKSTSYQNPYQELDSEQDDYYVKRLAETEFNFNRTSINGLAQAYGFILGQDFTLERIKKEFPELGPTVGLVNAQFDSSFPRIKSKLIELLVTALGKKLFNKTDRDLKKQLLDNLGKQVITKDIAKGFLQQVKERAEGSIESPVIEYMLSVNYLSFPAREFTDGYRQRFNSEGHIKAQGIKLALQLPKSWKAKEGERPHIIQKWVAQNGTGPEMILLDIRDTEGDAFTNDEVEAFVSSGEVKDSVPPGATYINSGVFSLEMRKGYWMEMAIIQERAGIHLYQHILMYQLFFQGKAIGLMCHAMNTKENRQKAEETFKKIQPLCQQVLNSIVLLQAY